MKKSQRTNLIIIILIFCSVLSVLFYTVSIRLEISEEGHKNYNIDDYDLDDIFFSDSLNHKFYIFSGEYLQISKVNTFLENLQKKSEEILYLTSLNCLYSCGFSLLIKNISRSKAYGKSNHLEINGVHVTEVELKVFKLIQEFLNDNRIFNKEKVLSYVKSRSRINGNLNTNGINVTLENLLKKNIILEGSKLTRRSILLNANREKICDLIKQYPGIYMNKISKTLNLCPYVVKWHLSKLLTFNLIRERNMNAHTVYYESTLSTENDIIFHTIYREKCRRIIEFLKSNRNGCTKNQISKALNMHFNTVTKYINEIDKFNLLVRWKESNKGLITLNEHNFKQLRRYEKSY